MFEPPKKGSQRSQHPSASRQTSMSRQQAGSGTPGNRYLCRRNYVDRSRASPHNIECLDFVLAHCLPEVLFQASPQAGNHAEGPLPNQIFSTSQGGNEAVHFDCDDFLVEGVRFRKANKQGPDSTGRILKLIATQFFPEPWSDEKDMGGQVCQGGLEASGPHVWHNPSPAEAFNWLSTMSNNQRDSFLCQFRGLRPFVPKEHYRGCHDADFALSDQGCGISRCAPRATQQTNI